jgi:hypothetical protein
VKVLLIGGTGKVGRPALREFVSRGHDVTVLARHPEVLADEFAQVPTVAGDAFDESTVAAAADGNEIIVSSVAMRDPEQFERSAVGLTKVLSAVALAQGVRWVSLGGAGSLEVSSGVEFVDTPDFPEMSKRESTGFRAALHELRDHAPAGLRWTVLSPPPLIDQAGERTGTFRTGGDAMLTTAEWPPRISVQDLAVALVDEVEKDEHPRARFTVAY